MAFATPLTLTRGATSTSTSTNLSNATCRRRAPSPARGRAAPRMLVVEAKNTSEMDTILGAAEGALVVVDYSTTWCGPCKVVAPKFEAMSDEFQDVVFVKVMGDVGDAPALMQREGIRSVPAFHFWKNNKQLHSIVGAKVDDIRASIEEYK